MKYLMILLTFSIISCRDIPVDKGDLLGDDYRLFQGTPAWDLAKAVEDQDVNEIKRQVQVKNIPVDYREERWKQTLLMLAVWTNKIKSVETLLELGADPNTPNDTVEYFGENAVIIASTSVRASPKILKLLLENGGNPNSVECGVQKDGHGNFIPARFFALYEAVPLFEDFEKVRMLVEAGADVNMQTETTGAGAMQHAIALDRMDVLLYLLEHGADYNRKFKRIKVISSANSASYVDFYVDILYELRLCVYPLNSKEYKDKLRVIEFLQKRGLDYWKSPLPDSAITIIKRVIKPKSEEELQEYIKRY